MVRLESTTDIYKSKKVIGILLLIALCISFFMWTSKVQAAAVELVGWFPNSSRGIAGAYYPANGNIYTNNGWGQLNVNKIWRFPVNPTVGQVVHTGWEIAGTQLAFASCGRIGDYIYFIGGGNLAGESGGIFRFHPEDSLQVVGYLAYPALLQAATATYNNAIYMAGGTDKYTQGNIYPYVLKYDGNNITTVGTLPTPLYDAAAAFTSTGKMIIFGGRTNPEPSGETTLIREFDITTGQTNIVGYLPRHMDGIGACSLGGRIFVFIPTETNDPNDITEIYEYKDGQLLNLGVSLPHRLSWSCIVPVEEQGKAYIIGGRDLETTEDYAGIFCFDPSKLPPGKPVVGIELVGKQVTLSWQPVSNAVSYDVEHSTNGTSWNKVATTTQTTYSTTEGPGTHYYRVRAKNSSGEYGEYSDPVSVSIGLESPSNLTATVQNRTVNLSWQPVQDAQSYLVQRSTDGQNWTTVAETTETNYTDTNTAYNTTYYYRVVAKSGEVLSEPSNTVQVTTGNIEKPGNLQISNLNGNQVTLTWNPAPGVGNYRVERSTDGQNWTTVGNSQNNSYTDNTLQPDQTYYYRVRSEDGGSISDPSNTVAIHTNPATPPPPQVVSGLTAIWEGNKIKVTWNRGQNEIPSSSMYQLFRQNADGSWVPVKTVSAAEKDSFTFYDANVLGGINYKYELRALGDFTTGFEWQKFAESGWATGNRPLVAPGRLRVSGNVLSWEVVEGASGYNVSYSIDGGATWQTTTVQGTSATLPNGCLAKVQAAGNENSDWSGVVRIP